MKKGKGTLICGSCGNPVHTCDSFNCSLEFGEKDDIVCFDNGEKHYCDDDDCLLNDVKTACSSARVKVV